MNDRARDDHEQYDELAAGYALDALEPDEELAFTAHLTGCSRCRHLLDEHAFVAAQLGALADGDQTKAPDWDSIRRTVLAEPPAADAPGDSGGSGDLDGSGGDVVTLDHRRRGSFRRRPPRILAAAAGVVALAGVGAIAWQASSGTGSSSSAQAIAACRHDAGCRVIALHASGGDAADVLVADGTARVVPLSLRTPIAGRTYVLWQMLRNGSPKPVGEFRDASSQTAPASLVQPYADTIAFAISLEPADVQPTTPTDVLAVGQTA
jgi:anti-sigma-K factor RskA